MEVKGILKERLTTQTGVSPRSGQPWRTDSYLVVIPGSREKHIVFEVRGDERCKGWDEFMKNLAANTPVLIKFEIDARQYQDRWFNIVEAWNIEVTNW